MRASWHCSAAIAAGLVVAACAHETPGRPAPAAISQDDVDRCVEALPTGMKAIQFTGLGHYGHAIATGNAEAQDYFNQGLTLLYTFNHPEAIHSFREAARIDPDAPMPYWGIAMAAGPDINTGATQNCLALAAKAIDIALAKAAARVPAALENADLRLAPEWLAENTLQALRGVARALPAASPPGALALQELDFALALSARYRRQPVPAPFPAEVCTALREPPCDASQTAVCVRRRDYANAMHLLAQSLPGDLDGLTLYSDALMNCDAWKWWSVDAQGELHPTPEVTLAIATLNRVLQQDVDHPGANHYLIHAVEESPTPGDALASAERLTALAPAAGHFVHMPSHVYRRVGRHDLATDANVAAVQADERYVAIYAEHGLSEARYPLHYLGHNQHFLTVSLAMQGREAEALDAAMRLGTSTLHLSHGYNAIYNQSLVEEKDDYFLSVPIQTVIRFGSWDRLEETFDAVPGARQHLQAGALPVTRTMLALAEGLRYLAGATVTGDGALEHYRAFAVQARAALDGAATKPLQFGNNDAADVLLIAAHVYAARLAERWERSAGAARSLQQTKSFFAATADSGLPLDPAILDQVAAGEASIAIWRQAVVREDALSYNEPSDWFYPVRESLGAAYVRHGNCHEAEAVFLRDVGRSAGSLERVPLLPNNANPDNPRSLYGLIECRQRLGEPVPPALLEAYQRNWRGSQPPPLAAM